MPPTYQEALRRIVRASKELADALRHAALVAHQVDPKGKRQDPQAALALADAAGELRAACALVPGARELLALSLYPLRTTEG